jgi:hypothetical protein
LRQRVEALVGYLVCRLKDVDVGLERGLPGLSFRGEQIAAVEPNQGDFCVMERGPVPEDFFQGLAVEDFRMLRTIGGPQTRLGLRQVGSSFP